MKRVIVLVLLLLSCVSFAEEMTYQILSPYRGMKTDKSIVLVKAKVTNAEMAFVNGEEVEIKNSVLYKVIELKAGNNNVSLEFIGNGQSVSEYFSVYSDVPHEYFAEITDEEEPEKLPLNYEDIDATSVIEKESGFEENVVQEVDKTKRLAWGLSYGLASRSFNEMSLGSVTYMTSTARIYYYSGLWFLPNEFLITYGESGKLDSDYYYGWKPYDNPFYGWQFNMDEPGKLSYAKLELRKYFNNILYGDSLWIAYGLERFGFNSCVVYYESRINLSAGYTFKLWDNWFPEVYLSYTESYYDGNDYKIKKSNYFDYENIDSASTEISYGFSIGYYFY